MTRDSGPNKTKRELKKKEASDRLPRIRITNASGIKDTHLAIVPRSFPVQILTREIKETIKKPIVQQKCKG